MGFLHTKEALLRCPHCKNKLIQKTGKKTRVRAGGAVEFLENGDCLSKCHWCKSEVSLPLQIREDTQIPGEIFILRKAKG